PRRRGRGGRHHVGDALLRPPRMLGRGRRAPAPYGEAPPLVANAAARMTTPPLVHSTLCSSPTSWRRPSSRSSPRRRLATPPGAWSRLTSELLSCSPRRATCAVSSPSA